MTVQHATAACLKWKVHDFSYSRVKISKQCYQNVLSHFVISRIRVFHLLELKLIVQIPQRNFF